MTIASQLIVCLLLLPKVVGSRVGVGHERPWSQNLRRHPNTSPHQHLASTQLHFCLGSNTIQRQGGICFPQSCPVRIVTRPTYTPPNPSRQGRQSQAPGHTSCCPWKARGTPSLSQGSSGAGPTCALGAGPERGRDRWVSRRGRRKSRSGRGREERRVGAHLGNLRVGSVCEPASERVGRKAARRRRERRGEERRAGRGGHSGRRSGSWRDLAPESGARARRPRS